MAIERIVSFLPSATELLYELGVKDRIFGVTHECLYPEDAKSKPRVITSVLNPDVLNSKEIDDKIIELMRTGQDIFMLDEKNLINARPDLIVSQEICEVCSAYTNQVNKALSILDKKPLVHALNPSDLQGILSSIDELAKKVGKEEQGRVLRKSLEKRIEYIKSKKFEKRPQVLCIEWVEPFFTSGHWIPEMVELAGGKNLISIKDEKSRRMAFEEVENQNPEIIIMMPCGFDTERTISEYKNILENNDQWNKLEAVKANNVYAVNANSYFSKPSIRTITGLEILAKIIQPKIFDDLIVPQNSFKQISS
ncbi:MAG: cobalamin-binding protein [Thaumarchaeota archaeon]|nr:cobalamin-binding protein [Nitrososphaerota archaeon]MBM3896278.1 cobalamin-binding protein [Nitrososphaerota archaeon]